MKMLSWIACLWMGIGCGVAPAQEGAGPRLVVVDFKKALAAHPKAKKLEAELKELQDNATRVLEAKQGELAALAEDARKVRDEGTTEDGKLKQENAKMILDMQKRDMEIRQSMMDVQNRMRIDMTEQRNVALSELAGDVREAVRTANAGQYDLILDSSALSREGFPQILDAPGIKDITDTVIALLPEEG